MEGEALGETEGVSLGDMDGSELGSGVSLIELPLAAGGTPLSWGKGSGTEGGAEGLALGNAEGSDDGA